MAYSFADLTADEVAFAAADKPILASYPDSPYVHSESKWIFGTSAGHSGSAGDNDAKKLPPRIADGLPGLQTSPNTASTLHTLYLRFSPAIEFDFVAILNHNLYSLGRTLCAVQVADDSTFTTNVQTVTSFASPSTWGADMRQADLTLLKVGPTADRFSGVEYARLSLAGGSSGKPAIGQLIFGRRHQLQFQPNRPWDPTALHTSMDRFESRGGVIVDTVRHRGRRFLDANLTPDSDTQRDGILDWFDRTLQGTSPFVWIDEPNSRPHDFQLFKMVEPSLEFPWVGPFVRTLQLRGREQGPNFLKTDPSP